MVQLYLLAGAIVTLGFLWFWIVRPIAVALWGTYVDWAEPREAQTQPRARRATRRRPRLRVRVMSRPIAQNAPRTAPEPEPQRSSEIPLPNGAEPLFNGSANPSELALNADEVIAVARMIDHNRTAAKPSKTSTIQAGFGLSRGGGPRYTRAALIYDTLFGPPAPAVTYRELSPEQEAVRAQLRMKQKGALN
jgi:hypothetical protein